MLVNQIKQSKHFYVILAVSLGIIGALANMIVMPMLPEVQLVLGNVAFIYAATRLKPSLALLTALITSTPLLATWGHPFGYITFGLEALFVSYFRSKGLYVLFVDIFYWLLIGMPLTALIILNADNMTDAYWLFIALKQGFNGILCTTIAAIITFLFIRSESKLTLTQQPALDLPLRSQLIHAIVLVTTFALITSALMISRSMIISSKQQIETSLYSNATQVAHITSVFLDKQQQHIRLSSNWISSLSSEQLLNAVNNLQTSLPRFHSIEIVDDNNNLLVSTQKRPAKSLPDSSLLRPIPEFKNISMSDVLNKDDALAYRELSIVAQVPSASGQVIKLIGYLNLALLTELIEIPEETGLRYVVTDANGVVVSASKELNLDDKQLFHLDIPVNNNALAKVRINNQASQEYSFVKEQLTNNWQVYILQDYRTIIATIEHEYMTIFISLIIAIIIASVIANVFGRHLTRSLKFILRQLQQFDDKSTSNFKPIYSNAPSELKHLYEQACQSKQQVIDYQHQLEEKVASRTQELHEANQKLQELAFVDSLTKVNNRRYLNENFALIQKNAQRNTALMAVIMIDLDHFKLLNDNHGHVSGDKCLVKVSALIRAEFCRDTDAVIRFGGEEFLILAPYITASALKSKLENLRATIANEVFVNQRQEPFKVTASSGAVIADADFDENVLTWVNIADKCLYEAKDSGRNKVIITDKVSRVS